MKLLAALKSNWYVWLFPFFALLIAVWLVVEFYSQKGVSIAILFDDAAGIQIDKTQVKFRGIPIGVVKKLELSEDHRDVVAKVLLDKTGSTFAIEGSRFSLVAPKVSFQGITGLSTLLDGTYISVLPGPSGASEKREFKATANSGSTEPLDDTSPFLLETASAESLSPGDAVTYRGVKIGSITKLGFARSATLVNIQINVENRHARLIRANTVFWRKAGMQAKFGLFHSEINVNSMDSIVNGGIELATPVPAAPAAKAFQKFALESAAPKPASRWSPLLD